MPVRHVGMSVSRHSHIAHNLLILRWLRALLKTPNHAPHISLPLLPLRHLRRLCFKLPPQCHILFPQPFVFSLQLPILPQSTLLAAEFLRGGDLSPPISLHNRGRGRPCRGGPPSVRPHVLLIIVPPAKRPLLPRAGWLRTKPLLSRPVAVDRPAVPKKV